MSIGRRHDSEDAASGYLHRDYAASFADVATPRELPHCGGWILERGIPGSDLLDGMGCYPIFACKDWANLPLDLGPLADRLVSLTMVTDPFNDCSSDDLRRWFDVVVSYKQHYITDLRQVDLASMPRRHRRNIAKALGSVRLETCDEPLEMLDEWTSLYNQLVDRHGVSGIATFSRAAFQKQLGVPGLVMFKASADGRVVGLHLRYLNRSVAYGHLGATSERGYELMAAYALYSYTIEQLRPRVRWLDLGAGPGAFDDIGNHGLRQFKAGWSTGTRPVYLCGSVLQPSAYARLVASAGIGTTSYFPAYRAGEFTSQRNVVS